MECAYVCQDLKSGKNGFTLNSENMKEAFDIQMTFLFEIKLQKVHL